MMTKIFRHRMLMVATLALASAVTFSSTLNDDLVWDDLHLRESVRERTDQGGILSLFSSKLLDVKGQDLYLDYYRPVFLLTLFFDSAIAEFIPQSYHLSNLLFHIIATISLLFLLFYLDLPKEAAFLAALVFAVHPIHAESVAFISGRTDILASIFTFLSASLWASSRETGNPPKAWKVAMSAIFLAIGGLAKEVALMLPLALVLIDLTERYKKGGIRNGWYNRTGIFAIPWMLVALLVFFQRWRIIGRMGATESVYDSAIAGALLDPWIIPRMWLTYLRLLVTPLKPSHWYLSSDLHISPLTLAALLFYFLAGVYLFKTKKARLFLLGTLWWVTFLLPVSGVVPVGGAIIAERFLYLPSAGFVIILGLLLQGSLTGDRKRFAGFAATSLLLLTMVGASAHRSLAWSSNEKLFHHMIETSPGFYMGYYEMALVQASKNRYSSAERYVRKAIEKNPSHAKSYHLLAQLLEERGEMGEALTLYRRGAWWNPSYLQIYLDLGKLNALLGQWEEAVKNLQIGLRSVENDAEALYRLGIAYRRLGREDLASLALSHALKFEPNNSLARYHLGSAYLGMGRTGLAQGQLEILRKQDPGIAILLANLMDNSKAGGQDFKP